MPRIAKRERAVPARSLRAEPRGQREPTIFVAVVHAADGIRFMAAADSRRGLVYRLAEYIERWGDYVLRPDHAREMRVLLVRGEVEAAVELYFALVGKRWDKEWLVTAALATGDHRDIVAALGQVTAGTTSRGGRHFVELVSQPQPA